VKTLKQFWKIKDKALLCSSIIGVAEHQMGYANANISIPWSKGTAGAGINGNA
jgi:hypothetical protein